MTPHISASKLLVPSGCVSVKRHWTSAPRFDSASGAARLAPAPSVGVDHAFSDRRGWDLRMGENFDRLAAKNNRRNTAAPARGHQDQIAPVRGGGVDDRLVNLPALGMTVSQATP